MNTIPENAKPQNPGSGPRPHTWCTGPDPVRHAQYRAWAMARAQAHFRKEVWEISFQEWVEIWGANWHRRGRGKQCLMMMKRRWDQPWTRRNAHLVDRPTFHARQATIRAQRAGAEVSK